MLLAVPLIAPPNTSPFTSPLRQRRVPAAQAFRLLPNATQPPPDAFTMGKAGEAEQAAPRPAPATSSGGWYRVAVCKIVNAKCFSVLLLAVGGFLSALFLLLHLRASGAIPDDPTLAEIQAGFILLMPYSELASHVGMLEKEIYKEIGVPNSKVSVSMRPYTYTHSTYVTFGILPEPRNSSINPASMTTLRKSLIQLTLQQLNLSLTPSVFGDPFCLEILGFPGGITVLLPHKNFHPEPIQPIFNITLDLTIHQIREFLEEMKIELESTLKQTPDEELFIELTNMNGSTVAIPVSVQVSLSSNDRSIYLELDRLKQLAQIVTEWNLTNLGLNISIFGKIRYLKLYPVLQDFMPACSPSLSPASIPSITRPPSWDNHETNPNGSFSCPALVKKQNTTIPHRKLSTRFHKRSGYGGKDKILQW